MPNFNNQQSSRNGQDRDIYDWIVVVIAFAAMVAAILAAVFTWQQAVIARDQMQRALRAYVIVGAELVPAENGLFVRLSAENMGQTPVYNLSYFAETVAASPNEIFPGPDVTQTRCDKLHPDEWGAPFATFSKTLNHEVRVSSLHHPIPDALTTAFQEGRSVYTYGTACYRDIFDQAHAFRFCYAWTNPHAGVGRCTMRQ